jgi:hypothetical protein
MFMRSFVTVSAALILVGVVAAQPAAPAPPATYEVVIRYRIDAGRTERIVQFREMTRYLESIGFKKEPSPNENEPADPTVTEMAGSIASANLRKILQERHVRTVLAFPQGTKPPMDGNQLVRVDLELTSGMKADIEQRLYAQTRAVLGDIGFQEGICYDNRNHLRIVGNISWRNLTLLLADLRGTPSGAKQPGPFQNTTPIRLVVVEPGLELVKPLPEQPAAPAGQEKLAPEVRALLGDKDAAAKPHRMEILLWLTPAPEDRRWQADLRGAVTELLIEGQLGPVVSVVARPDQIPALAALPSVTGIRLLRAARLDLEPANKGKGDAAAALRKSGLEKLHKLGHKGRGVRIAVIDGDFQGWQNKVKEGRLPARTRLVDLTAERNQDIAPDPFEGDPAALGHGTRCALAAMQAAPEAELVLVRVDPAAPYQLQEAARYINGETFFAPSLEQRASELAATRESLNLRRQQVLNERQTLLDSNLPFEEFQEKWAAHRKKAEALEKEEKATDQRAHRLLNLLDDLRSLKGVRVVASSLNWYEGQPVDGSGALSRYFDDRPFRAALWFQAAGDTSGQSWAGLFRDMDGNGAMEFVAPGTKLPLGAKNPEVNVLGWKSEANTEVDQLPAGARVRITMQWREAHDPDFLRNGQDVYREPLAKLRLLVLRQRDPSGSKLPADDWEVVAQSEVLPLRLDNQAASATYEHAVEFTASAEGRYAIMLLGRAPTSTRPPDALTLAATHQAGELRLRIFVNTLAGKGRAVLSDFTSDQGATPREEGSLGTPSDAHAVITVGSVVETGGAAVYSAPGPAFNLELLRKPDVLAYDTNGAERGTSLAASFAGGLSASALSAGAPRARFLETMRLQPGGVLHIPADWPFGNR